MTKLDKVYLKARCAMKDTMDKFLKDERGDVNVVSIVVLIAVAVVLALAFKDQIKNLLDKLFKGIFDDAGHASDDVSLKAYS